MSKTTYSKLSNISSALSSPRHSFHSSFLRLFLRGVAIFSLVFLLVGGTVSLKLLIQDNSARGGYCYPDGIYMYLELDQSVRWPPVDFFTISHAFGRISFSTAKLLDVAWDVVIGRGGQALLTWVAYRVFTKSVTCLMESTIVPYRTFATVTLREPSLSAIWDILVRITAIRGVHARFILGWIIVGSAYIVALPTLLSASTGYVSINEHYVNWPNGSLIAADDIKLDGDLIRGYRNEWTISDARRLGFKAAQATFQLPSGPVEEQIGNTTLTWIAPELLNGGIEECQYFASFHRIKQPHDYQILKQGDSHLSMPLSEGECYG